MKPLVAFLLIISICLVSVIGLSILSTERNKTNGHIFKESGTCPNCGKNLLKASMVIILLVLVGIVLTALKKNKSSLL